MGRFVFLILHRVLRQQGDLRQWSQRHAETQRSHSWRFYRRSSNVRRTNQTNVAGTPSKTNHDAGGDSGDSGDSGDAGG